MTTCFVMLISQVKLGKKIGKMLKMRKKNIASNIVATLLKVIMPNAS